MQGLFPFALIFIVPVLYIIMMFLIYRKKDREEKLKAKPTEKVFNPSERI